MRKLVLDALKYNLIKGASVVKLVQAVLVLSHHQPWPDDMNASVETVIDFAVGIVVLLGVGQAHNFNSNESPNDGPK